MPSPVGHALGGIAAGWLVAPRRGSTVMWRLAAVGAAADLDLLFHAHRGPSHSAGAAVLAGLVVLAVTRSPRWGSAAALAWGSHVLLDWVGEDSWPPIGIPAWWPISREYVQSRVVLFPSISRQYWRADFLADNARALFVEVLVLAPIVAIVLAAARSLARRRQAPLTRVD